MALKRALIRPMIGELTFAVLMLTVGLGFLLRAFAGGVWGADPKAVTNPFSGYVFEYAGLVIGYENLAVMVGTALLCIGLAAYLRFTRLGISIGVIEQFAQVTLPTNLANSSAYLVMLLMLVLRPGGLFTSIQRKKV